MKRGMNAIIALGVAALLGGCSSENESVSSSGGAASASSDKSRTVIAAINNGKSRKDAGAAVRETRHAIEPVSDDTPLTSPTVLVTGRITFADGKPVSSATVALKGYLRDEYNTFQSIQAANAVTNDEGNYRLRGSDADQLSLYITGDVPSTQVSLEARKSGNSKTPALRKIVKDIVLMQAYPLNGRIVNEKNEPLGNLAVHIKPAYNEGMAREASDSRMYETQLTTATASGEFDFKHVAGGNWMIGTSSPGYAPEIQRIQIPTTETVTLKLDTRGATVKGYVFNKGDGSPAPGMGVHLGPRSPNQIGEIESKSTTSTADGSFIFEHIPPGKQHLYVATNPERTLGMALPIPEPLDLSEGETTDVALFVYPGSRVMGQVFDKDTSEPLHGARISISYMRPTQTAETDASGNYQLNNIFPNGNSNVTLNVKLDGYGPDSGSSRFSGDPSVALPEDGSPAVRNIPMVRMVKIKGQVVTRDEVPIPHAQVKLLTTRNFSTDKGTQVKSDGTFEIETVPFVECFVDASAKGYGPAKSESLDVTTKDIEGLKIIMDVGATIQGTVVDPSGKPVASAKVTNSREYAFGSTTYSTNDEVDSTGEDGLFTFTDAPIKVELKATKEGLASSEEVALDLKPGESKSGVVLTLREAFSISGRVLNTARQPIEGASLNANGNGAYDHTTTAKDGTFELDGLPEGIYSVYAYGKGPSKNVQGVKAGTKDLEIIMGEVGSMELIGTVLDDIDDRPITDFKVTTDHGFKVEKQGDATFRAWELQPNHGYTLKISSPKHEEQSFSFSTSDNKKHYEQTFRLGKGGIITGRVVERGTGKALPDITVVSYSGTNSWERTQNGPSAHSVTDAEGKFVLAPVPTGETTISAKPGAPFTETFKTVQVSSDKTADAGDIEIAKGGTINGIVVRGTPGEPVPNYSVRLYSYQDNQRTDKRVSTDAEGRFEFTGLGAANYTLTAGSRSQQVVLAPEGSHEVTIRIGGVVMTGLITRGGVPTASSISASMGETRISTYAQNGEYKLADIEPGTYEFSVGSGNNPTKETVEVPDIAEFKKDFALPDGGIRVTVVDSGGSPVPDVQVSLSRQSSGTGFDQRWIGQSQPETTDVSGVAEFKGLPAGTFSVSARKEDVGSAMKSDIQVQDNQTQNVQLQLDSNGGTLVSVALSSATGQGLKEAWCYLYGPTGQFTHSTTRDAAGVMTIKNIPPGTYTTNVSYWSHSQSEKQVEIKAGETATIEDVLYPAGAIHWNLKKADGTPAAEATVTVTPITTTPEERPRNGSTNSAGLFVERGLAAGSYQVTAQLAGKPAISENFEVAAGGNNQKSTTVPTW